MKAFLKNLLRKTTGGKSSISKITQPMAKILRDLEVFAADQHSAGLARDEQARKLTTEATDLIKQSLDATMLAKKYQDLVLPANI